MRRGLLKIKSKFCPSKVHSYLLFQIVVICFSNMYHLLSPNTTFEDERILKSAFEFSYIFETTIHCFISKVHYYMFVIYLLKFIIINIFLFKLAILIHNFFATLMIWPYVYGIWIEYISQKVQCDAKNEPPYLITTMWRKYYSALQLYYRNWHKSLCM